jgi:hypothetical protein
VSRPALTLLLVLLSYGLWSQPAPAVTPGCDLQQEEELANIRRSDQRFFDLRTRVGKLWDGSKEDFHAKILALPRNEKTKANVFLAVGLALSERSQHQIVDAYLDAIGQQRYDAGTLANVSGAVLSAFHAKQSIFSELDAALVRFRDNEAGLTALCAVYPRLVNGNRDGNDREADVERHEACRRLVALWSGELAGEKTAIVAALAELVEDVRQGGTAREWSTWLGRVGVDEEPPRLSIDLALRQALAETRAQLEKIRRQRREEVRQLIGLMLSANQAPIAFLAKEDPDVRKTALVAIQGMAADLQEPARHAALRSLLDLAAARAKQGPVGGALLGDLLTGATALARGAPEEDRRRLSRLALSETVGEDRPELARSRLEAVRVSGLPLGAQELQSLYARSRAGDRADDADWVAVRIKLVEAAVVGNGGAELVLAMIQDPDPKVRGAAAATCVRLVKRFAAAETNALALVAERLRAEDDAVTRRRLLEAFRALLETAPERFQLASLEGILTTFDHEDLETRKLAAAAAQDLLALEGRSEELRDRVRSRLAKALANGGSDELKVATAAAFVPTRDPKTRDAILSWLQKVELIPNAASSLRPALITSFGRDAEALWAEAQEFAAREAARPRDFDWAAAFGEAALALTEGDEPASFSGDAAAARSLLLRWWEQGREEAFQLKALSRLDVLVSEAPLDGSRLERRIALLERRVAGTSDTEKRAAWRKRLGEDLRRVTGSEVTGLDAKIQSARRRQLGRLEFEEGRVASARKLIAGIKDAEAKDRALLALFTLVDERGDARLALEKLATLPAAPEIWDETQRQRLRAAARYWRSETLDLELARGFVTALPSEFGPRQALLDAIEKDRALVKRLEEPPVDDEAKKALMTALKAEADRGITLLTALLLRESAEPKTRRAWAGLLRELVGEDAALSKIVEPKNDEAAAWKSFSKSLWEWRRQQRPLQKSMRPFLIGL